MALQAESGFRAGGEMTNSGLAGLALLYIIGLLAMRRMRHRLPADLWGSLGLVALVVLASKVGGWNIPLGSAQARLFVWGGNLIGLRFGLLEPAGLIVPDLTGYSILQIEVECSNLIEATVFAALMLFYPRFQPRERLLSLGAGVSATVAVNLVRLGVIVAMVSILGKPALPWAHAIVGRLLFFAGIIVIYWHILTLPTLQVVGRDLEVTGRAVK
jgi:exosortase family protein XrtG